jgi:hypothetical protein
MSPIAEIICFPEAFRIDLESGNKCIFQIFIGESRLYVGNSSFNAWTMLANFSYSQEINGNHRRRLFCKRHMLTICEGPAAYDVVGSCEEFCRAKFATMLFWLDAVCLISKRPKCH